MISDSDIITNIQHIQQRIQVACERSKRPLKSIQLLLATKTVDADRIKVALKNGTTYIAENRVQELKEKYEALKNTPHTNHFIGHLQTNKIKDVLKCDVTCIHSIDRLDLAEKLHQRLLFEKKTMDILIQVNTSYEESKFGVSPDEALTLIEQVSHLSTLKIKGLMTIGLLSSENEKVRKCFRLLRDIQQKAIALAIPNVEMEELSMGMSGDFEAAIEEGATIVRVGTSIFGKRPTLDSFYWNENK